MACIGDTKETPTYLNLRWYGGKCSYRWMPWDFWLVFFFLGVVVPWRGALRMKKLLAKPETSARERIRLYVSTIAVQWAIALFTAWRAWARGFTGKQLGLWHADWVEVGVASVLGGLFVAALHWGNLRRAARVGGAAAEKMRTLAAHILPRNTEELIPYIGLSVTAGVCEEFLYRGFAFGVLERIGLPIWLVVIATSVLFGLAHLYQGRGGVLGTTILGLVFALGREFLGSALPPMVWHSVVDVVAGIAGPRYLLRGSGESLNGNSELQERH